MATAVWNRATNICVYRL